MVDSGATGISFIDASFVQTHNLTLQELDTPRRLRVVDGRASVSGDITHTATFSFNINSHVEQLTAFVTKFGHYDVILGKPWLHKHNPVIDWESNLVSFKTTHCKSFCLPTSCHQLAIHGLKFKAPKTLTPTNASFASIRRLGAASFNTHATKKGVEVFSASLYEIDQLLQKGGVDIAALDLEGKKTKKTTPTHSPCEVTPDPGSGETAKTQPDSVPNQRVGPSGHHKSYYGLHQMDLNLNSLALEDVPDIDRRQLAADLYCSGASLDDIRIALETKPKIDPRTKLPQHLHHHLPAFDTEAADKLPPHRDCDHHIELKPGETPPHGPLYNMSVDELKVLRKFLKEHLDKGFIRASTSPAASPVLFAKKPGGGLRLCVDYRALNAITIKNRYPLPLIQETLSRLSQAKYYTKLDVIAAFNKIRIEEGQEWLTAFNTRYGLFETLVMPFGLSNAPATFQARINEVLRPYLDIFCTAYIDDVLVYSNTLKEHRKHVNIVLQALRDAGLYLDIKKCEFEVQEVTYLGMIVSTAGVRMDPAKVACITGWEDCSNVKDVQAFLGFANFYRRFIKNFSRIVRPLVALTRKNHTWDWSIACQNSFKTLKTAFTTAPALSHFDPTKEIFVETDASDFVSSGVLSQKGADGVLHPVAFMSKKYDPAECNYEIYDKELLAIVRSFEGWRAELQGASHPITVLTDHRNLEYFMTTKQLSRRQVRWSEFLSQFDFVISYRPGKEGRKPDSLTRRSQDLPQDSSDARIEYQNQALFKPRNLDETLRQQQSNHQAPTVQDDGSAPLSTLDDFGDIPSETSPTNLDLDYATLNSSLFQDLNFAEELLLSPTIVEPEEEPLNAKIARLLEEGYRTDEFYRKIFLEMTKSEGIPHSKEISLSECALREGRLYFRDRIYVPDTNLRPLLVQLAHDSVETGHPGKNKMYEILSRDYFWPKISYDTARFVRNCHGCCRNKTSKLRYQGTLKPLPLPIQRWRDISVDFIGPFVKSSLPGSQNDCMMVVVDRLTKERHYVPCNTKMKAIDLARLFCRDIWKLHGLPDTIVSDRGSLFVSELWKAVCHLLQINIALSTAYHPETDGQTEIANAYLEQYLRQFVDHTQGDWEQWTPMAEFAANNAVSSSTGVTPFFANKGYHPRMSFGPPRALFTGASRAVRDNNKLGTQFADKMKEILELLRTNLTAARATQEGTANRNRQPAPAYRVNDEVFLDTRNITTARPMKKLDHKFFGPYIITEVLGSHNYKLRLPFEHELMHDTFHTSLLRPAPKDPLPGQTNPPPPPITIDSNGQKLYAIDAIVDAKRENNTFFYQVLWRGYDPSNKTWEPLQNVVNARASILEFERRYPKKIRPTKTEITKARETDDKPTSPSKKCSKTTKPARKSTRKTGQREGPL